jgi:hypothetical protein
VLPPPIDDALPAAGARSLLNNATPGSDLTTPPPPDDPALTSTLGVVLSGIGAHGGVRCALTQQRAARSVSVSPKGC